MPEAHDEEWDGVDRRAGRWKLALAIGLVGILALTSFINAVFIGPSERAEIRETADQAKELAVKLEDEAEKRVEAQTGYTALTCTGSNRHDSIDQRLIDGLLEVGIDLTDVALEIPPRTNCGELLCQIIVAVEENADEAVIEIDDPFGPDREKKPCVPPPPE
jgi:hypothetical protein